MKKITSFEDIQKLPQPLPQEFFEVYEKKILAHAPLISRVKLCRIASLNRNTLRNLDFLGAGIEDPIQNPYNKRIYYRVEAAVAFLKEKYCDKPKRRIDEAYKELKKYEEEQKAKQSQIEKRY